MRMKYMVVLVALFGVSNFSYADTTGKNQAEDFAKLYAKLCLKNLNSLDALSQKLSPAPQLPANKANFFLSGQEGKAWPVPSKYGKYILAIHSNKRFCALYAKEANTEIAKTLFTKLLANAPAPLISKQVRNEQKRTIENGDIQTISYEWSVPDAARKMLFTITIAPSASANIQVLGSAALVSN